MPVPRALVTAAVAAAAAVPAAAVAQIGLPLPDPTQVVTQTTDPVTGTVTDPTGTVGTVTGTVGGVVATTTGTVTQTVDQVLGGSLPSLPTGTIDGLLGAAGLPGINGANGAPGSPGVTTTPNGTVVVDTRPPTTTVKVLDSNRRVGRTGRLRLRITSDEPSVVVLAGSVTPGRGYHLRGRRARQHSRKAIRIPRVVLGYRTAGALRLTIQFSRGAQRNLRQSYNSTVRLSLVAVDVARNQVTRKLRRVVRH
jgi:hypothetical protein